MAAMPIGEVTRGTTGTNRLRRVDRFIASLPWARASVDPLVVDLGYGASGVTVFELASRLRRLRGDVRVLGLEIEPARVSRAQEQLGAVLAGSTGFPRDLPVSFAIGGFEIPTPGGRRAAVIRALNVLRQYEEGAVAGAWRTMLDRVQDGGIIVEGTCDETGRIASWVTLDPSGPRTLTLSLRLAGLQAPSVVAERLPKVLIHRNVEGERVNDLMLALDTAWARAAPLASYGPRQRWLAATDDLAGRGWRILTTRARRRLGELTVPWEQVAPLGWTWPASARATAKTRQARDVDR